MHFSARSFRFGLGFIAAGLCFAAAAQATPYRPADAGEVIEKIPEALRGPEGKEYAELRAVVESQTENREAAVRFIKLSIARGRRLNDPRFFGYAEAVVTAELAKTPSDPELLTLRATLKQRRHDFSGAREDLEKVIKKSGGNAQTWVTLATVQVVTGDADGAKKSCAHLFSRTSDVTLTSCLALAESLSGGAEKSYPALENDIAKAKEEKSANEGEILWAISILAEFAERLGKDADAERWYKESLAADPEDSFALAAYADFLLSHGRNKEVIDLLRGREASETLLLRLSIAEKLTGAAEYVSHHDVLKARFDGEEQRGESIHGRERAIFELVLEGNPESAAQFAKANWAIQKEALDLRILAESAAAAKDKEGLQMVADWMKQSGWEDVRVKKALEGKGL